MSENPIAPSARNKSTKKNRLQLLPLSIKQKNRKVPQKQKIETRSLYSAGERAILCTVCGETLDSEEIEQLPEMTPEEYKAQCQTFSYDTIARNPGQYDGEYAKISGYILQVQQNELNGLLYTLRVATVGKYDGVVYVSYTCSADDARILEDDYVTMWGQLTGEKTYTTVIGNSITIPSFSAEYVQ